MNAIAVDGKTIAAALKACVKRDVAFLRAEFNFTPGLAVVLVGTDPASSVYVKNKARQAQAVGFRSEQFLLPCTVDETELLRVIETLNVDHSIDGILVQLPLPGHIDRWRVLEAIDPAKDVDGFHPYNVGRLSAGQPSLAPCTPLGVMHLIKSVAGDLSGLDVVVIGRSNIVGKPLAILLGDAGCTVTGAQLQTRNLPEHCRKADIVVAAAGCAGLVRGDWITPGAIVIDVGINRVIDSNGTAKLVGDVAFAEVSKRASYITPVPGGVGPMTVAYLLANTLNAAVSRRGLSSAVCPDVGQTRHLTEDTVDRVTVQLELERVT
ncbi:bifunctional methylenetetrahydrofolate dehydrogenase/methenyltetrahydrofolate cyclohydrolase FolD [Bradyrhizobium sp. ERR14]|uniref:bifunctional methylenetetrahydrofolate dehydrogenase/methenyltetrahydrofolate cyclohydrolase FolD n=1 Tax=Bradyrhizobium sp. ERR14 TaxID=2663837 RepID=UPI00161DFF3F|nr:bifunctional methylenetetrahydrofolate dehydrogenase/methenyltetrahydrofolate cyclohydrolase FolD [Bradyrhizobium sp. ERR14]MBB4398508.1 methylenetetrahydrofolate dehydrogenase (NADP+)/methenyltetrahydrofolate cyclohydrolase [Bradyrhizobium sp. ERR14]